MHMHTYTHAHRCVHMHAASVHCLWIHVRLVALGLCFGLARDRPRATHDVHVPHRTHMHGGARELEEARRGAAPIAKRRSYEHVRGDACARRGGDGRGATRGVDVDVHVDEPHVHAWISISYSYTCRAT